MILPDGYETNSLTEAFERGRLYERDHAERIDMLDHPTEELDGHTQAQEFNRLINTRDPHDMVIAVQLAIGAAVSALEETHLRLDDALAVQKSDTAAREHFDYEVRDQDATDAKEKQ